MIPVRQRSRWRRYDFMARKKIGLALSGGGKTFEDLKMPFSAVA